MDDRMASVTYREFLELLLSQSAELGRELIPLNNENEDEKLLLDGFSADFSLVNFEGPKAGIYPVVVRPRISYSARIIPDSSHRY